ncbi:phage tail tube protein [Methylobacterium sp. SD21]|uniref:phage tail tube protein n=1 Tax=Methylobacterium litchii TaxID=3138810 RepID=UPI00313C9049
MAAPTLLPGNRFRAYRGTGTPPNLDYDFVCLGTSITLTQTNTFEDATVADCDNPVEIPNRKSTVQSRAWSGRIAGTAAADHLDDLRTDVASETAIPYAFVVDPKNGQGVGYWHGDVFVESMEITKSNNGLVNFTLQFRGDGPLSWSTGALP